MSQAKIIDLRFLSIALVATGSVYCSNPLRAATSDWNTLNLELAFSDRVLNWENFRAVRDDRAFPARSRSVELLSMRRNPSTASIRENSSPGSLLLADADNSGGAETKSDPQSRFLRLLALSFLLLFFVPLGIFYPLFLFYRKLLVKPEKPVEIFNRNRRLELSQPHSISSSKAQVKVNRATVSKLQIAFLPPARDLRQELSRVCAIAESNVKCDFLELMQQVIAVLIEQQHWTHASYNSKTCLTEKVKSEFDSISNRERRKLAGRQSGLIDYNRNLTSTEGYERNYSYVVVTLILCTSHSSPLFEGINSKERLHQELVQLSQIEKNTLTKFELLWNPQQEGVYISNERLLVEYDDMTRLL